MRSIKKNSLLTLIVLLITLGFLDFYESLILRQQGAYARFTAVEDLAAIQTPLYQTGGYEQLKQDFQSNDQQVLLSQVMNTVQKMGPHPSGSVLEIYQHVLNGGGAVCSGMASLYSNILWLNGIQARQVMLRRNMFDVYDLHITVEVFDNDRWVIYDPTFNVSFQKHDRLLGAQEIKESLYDGSFEEIEPVFYGDVLYPARLETYYMHWLPLFNNVFVHQADQNVLTKLPPFRYWLGPKYYYQPVNEQGQYQYRIQDDLYFTVVVIMPLAMVLICFGIVWLVFSVIHEQQRLRKDSKKTSFANLP
jgi:hypothetical protein